MCQGRLSAGKGGRRSLDLGEKAERKGKWENLLQSPNGLSTTVPLTLRVPKPTLSVFELCTTCQVGECLSKARDGQACTDSKQARRASHLT